MTTKGQLVMHPVYKLLWVKGVKGDVLTCNPVSSKVTKTLRSIFTKEVIKATRSDVEAYLKEKGWWLVTAVSCSNDKSNWIVFSVFGEWNLMLDTTINPADFDTAPTQLAEAILMARLLNATKD